MAWWRSVSSRSCSCARASIFSSKLSQRPELLHGHGGPLPAPPGPRPVHAAATVPSRPLLLVLPPRAEHALDTGAEATRNLLQHPIAYQVTQAVVDVLEPVDVHEDDRQ